MLNLIGPALTAAAVLFLVVMAVPGTIGLVIAACLAVGMLFALLCAAYEQNRRLEELEKKLDILTSKTEESARPNE